MQFKSDEKLAAFINKYHSEFGVFGLTVPAWDKSNTIKLIRRARRFMRRNKAVYAVTFHAVLSPDDYEGEVNTEIELHYVKETRTWLYRESRVV